jgi:anaerobic magnesium-protoporphyrin IX monomethyl ester cyclase
MKRSPNNNFDIVLLSPPSRSFNHYRPPMALIYLSGYLKHHGLKPKIIDITEKSVIRDTNFINNIDQHTKLIESAMVSEIKRSPSMIFGITCYTPEYYEVLKLSKTIKEIYPRSKIIVGGIHPTLFPNELLSEPNTPIDYEVIGEGEETLLELVNQLISTRPHLLNVKGIAYKNSGIIIKTSLRPVRDNLDEISFPDYSQLDMDYYTNASPYSVRGCYLRSFYLLATRGCPSTCTFCVARQLRNFNGGGRYTRVRSAQNIVDEIKLLKHKYHIDSFYFIDDLFTISKDNVIEFCNLLKSDRLNLLWGCSSKVSTLNEEILHLMSDAGCVQIDFGVERGSDKALKDIQKGISIEMVKQVFRWCQKYHIRTFANFLVNLPGETLKDLKDIETFTQHLHPDIVSMNVFTPYPGTDIYDHSDYHFPKEEYPLLTYASTLIEEQPKKFRFSKHKIDILSWANKKNKQYNRFLPNLMFHLSPRYIKTIFNSKRKSNYFSQFRFLVQEYFNQKT